MPPSQPGHTTRPPPNVVLMAPAEEISTDFMSYGSQSILVIKDRQSGFIAAKLTKDKTTKAAIEALKTWFFNYGFAPQFARMEVLHLKKHFSLNLTS